MDYRSALALAVALALSCGRPAVAQMQMQENILGGPIATDAPLPRPYGRFTRAPRRSRHQAQPDDAASTPAAGPVPPAVARCRAQAERRRLPDAKAACAGS